jgi:TatD DNase family protein
MVFELTDARLIDSHCHFPHSNYEKSIKEIIAEAKAGGVVKFISIGTSEVENKKSIEVANNFDEVFTSIGIYPHEDLGKSISELREILIKQLDLSKKIVGIGECGVDVSEWKGGRKLKEQLEVFEMQVNIACEKNLPLIIHNRNGDKEILEILNERKNKLGSAGVPKGAVHCFSSTWEGAKQFLDLGFYLSFSAMITYPSRKTLEEVVKNVPEDKFLLETDSPYLPVQGHRGEVNYPKYVKMIAEKASQIKEKPFEEICRFSYNNTIQLFKL